MVPKVATLELGRLSNARDLLARVRRRIVGFVDSSFWSAIAAFALCIGLCVLGMIAFSWLSNVFQDAGIPLLGSVMTLMVWVMGLALVALLVAGKYWILFR